MFTSMLTVSGGDEAEISVNSSGLMQFKCGKASMRIQTLNADDFPAVNIAYPENTIKVSGLSQIAKKATAVASEVQNNPAFDCVKVNFSPNKTTATATDSMRFIKTGGTDIADGEMELIIPKRALNLICDIAKAKDDLYLGTVGNKIVFISSEFVFTASMISSKSHNIEEIIERVKPVYSAVVDGKEFYEAVDLLISAIGDNDSCINVKLTNNSLCLFVHNENGDCDIEVAADNAVSTGENVFYYRPIYLYDFLKDITGSVKFEITDRGVLKLSEGLTDYIVSPRNAPKIKIKAPEKKLNPKAKTPKNKKGKSAEEAA